MSDFNAGIIEEFRANAGKVGGPFEGGDLLLLHTVGARTGAERVSPLAYAREGDAYLVAGSAAGADHDPAWVHNVVTHPEVEAEIGTDTVALAASVVRGPERRRLYDKMIAVMPGFAAYEDKTSREIPVIVLSPR